MNFIFGKKCPICKERKKIPRSRSYCDDCEETWRRCDSCHELSSPKELRFNSRTGMDICLDCRRDKDNKDNKDKKDKKDYHATYTISLVARLPSLAIASLILAWGWLLLMIKALINP